MWILVYGSVAVDLLLAYIEVRYNTRRANSGWIDNASMWGGNKSGDPFRRNKLTPCWEGVDAIRQLGYLGLGAFALKPAPPVPNGPPPCGVFVIVVAINSSFGWYDETTAFESVDVPHSNKACYQIEDWRTLETWEGGRERRRESQEVRKRRGGGILLEAVNLWHKQGRVELLGAPHSDGACFIADMVV